jgi:ribulose-phosphate 3-epimerase
MSVNPGFGGQKFIPSAVPKIRELRRMADEQGLDLRIEVDGGITDETIGACFQAGADAFVAGSYVFGGKDYADRIRRLREAGTRA